MSEEEDSTREIAVPESLESDDEEEYEEDDEEFEEDDELTGVDKIKSQISQAFAPLMQKFNALKKKKSDEEGEEYDEDEEESDDVSSEEDDEDEGEEEVTKTHFTESIVDKFKEFTAKFGKKSTADDGDATVYEEDEDSELEDEESEFDEDSEVIEAQPPQLPAFLVNLREKVPQAAPLIDKIPPKLFAKKPAGKKATAAAAGGKAKFKLTPIQIIIVAGLAGFLLLGDEEKEVDPLAGGGNSAEVKARKKKARLKKIRAKKMAEAKKKKEEEKLAKEKAEKERKEKEALAAKEAAEQAEMEKQAAVVEEQPTKQESVDVVDIENKMDDQELDNAFGETPDKKYDIPDIVVGTDITKQILNDLQVEIKKEKKQKKEIEVVKPVNAPAYESHGRALVYNCRDKHWACVDEDSYSKCRKNYSWNKYENLPVECYPSDIVGSSGDCHTLQQRYIDNAKKIDFCKFQ